MRSDASPRAVGHRRYGDRVTAAAEHPVTLVPGSLVRVRATKWDRLPHWEFDGIWLGTDIHGAWLGFPQGTRYDRPGHGFTAEWASVTLFPPAGWAPSFVVGHPRGLVTYVDLVTVPEWWSDVSGWTVSYVDLDLDVVERTGEAAFIDDEDEFAENAARFAYPPEVVYRVRADAAAVLGAVIGNEPPFDEATRAEWLARMRKLVGG